MFHLIFSKDKTHTDNILKFYQNCLSAHCKMIVYAVYVMTRDGLELVSEKFQAQVSIPDTTLLSALMVAFQQMAESVTTLGIPKKIGFDELTYHLRSFGNFQIVIVSDTDNEPTELLLNLGYQFLNEYKNTLYRWDGNQSIFTPFKDVIKKIIQSEGAIADLSQSLNPGKYLDARTVMSLPTRVQTTARVLIAMGASTFADLMEELNCEEIDLIEDLDYLRENGYVGIKNVDGINKYFTSSWERN